VFAALNTATVTVIGKLSAQHRTVGDGLARQLTKATLAETHKLAVALSELLYAGQQIG
jgi:hypothetical protein